MMVASEQGGTRLSGASTSPLARYAPSTQHQSLTNDAMTLSRTVTLSLLFAAVKRIKRSWLKELQMEIE